MKKAIIILSAFGISYLIQGQNLSRDMIIKVIANYQEKNNELISCIKYDSSQNYINKLRKDIEQYNEKEVIPALNSIEQVVCKHKDDILLTSLFNLIISVRNSADVQPAWTLASIYLCQPDYVIEMIKINTEKELLIRELKFGFDQITYENKDSIKNYSKLKNKIETPDELRP
jgi:hypothetical protein